jgi:hypothetical protein
VTVVIEVACGFAGAAGWVLAACGAAVGDGVAVVGEQATIAPSNNPRHVKRSMLAG